MTPAQYKTLRRRIGSQQRVAELLGVSRPTVWRREQDDARITEEAAIAIRELARLHPAPGAPADP